MPCSDGGYSRNLEIIEIESTNKEMQVKIDELTNMLCELCSVVDVRDLPADVRSWYKEHLVQDATRVVKSFNEKSHKLSGQQLRQIEAILDSLGLEEE